ncbi:MAG TPA: gluconeogenesis factor YvcK family protein [Candidatus Paceibacterota bacterium]|nr:gluconeogenesis factor YvcK family protein [Candidatus Paceibacterota bacterium]
MKKIVTIGGGTGSFITLRGLKKYQFDITAIVNIFDSGGSSGVLRDEYGILPPGDIRRCLVALASEEKEPILRDLFSYRFENGSLGGHSFGNLMLTALDRIKGNYLQAIEEASKILEIKGKVLPISLDKATLCAELENGQIIEGETNIDVPKHDGTLKIKRVFLKPEATILPQSAKAIEEADLIVIGPGDLYTSIIPNFLVKGFKEAINMTRGKIVYTCNLMTKWGETNDFVASDFVKELLSYSDLKKLNVVICNDKEVKEPYLSRYAEEKKYPLKIDNKLSDLTDKVIKIAIFKEADVVRHDSDSIAKVINSLL